MSKDKVWLGIIGRAQGGNVAKLLTEGKVTNRNQRHER